MKQHWTDDTSMNEWTNKWNNEWMNDSWPQAKIPISIRNCKHLSKNIVCHSKIHQNHMSTKSTDDLKRNIEKWSRICKMLVLTFTGSSFKLNRFVKNNQEIILGLKARTDWYIKICIQTIQSYTSQLAMRHICKCIKVLLKKNSISR